jgi:hypothetical protein
MTTRTIAMFYQIYITVASFLFVATFNALNIAERIASNDRITNELERIWRGLSIEKQRYYTTVCLEGIMKPTMKQSAYSAF